MTHWAAITVLGQDRPGIVAGVTRVLFEHGCNLEDSSATRLRDAFAMILIAQLPDPPHLGDLRAALRAEAAALGVAVDLRDLGTKAPVPPPAGRRYLLSVYGADQPGIVYRVSRELADCTCNVADVATRRAGGASAPIYIMMLEMTVPEAADLADIQARLDRLRAELQVDITLRAVEEETL
ncbi:MAG: amino acid-binding protein [Armatimonadetes bacterium]|nr:amino acid-binding protein [Armatimonadota bacterium]